MILLKNRDRNPSFKKGEYVEINDAGNYPMELSVDGVCKQETTEGKNYIIESTISYTYTKETTNNVTRNLGIDHKILDLKAGTKLTLSYYLKRTGNYESLTNDLRKDRFGIHGAINYINSNGETITKYPLSNYINSNNNGSRVSMSYILPDDLVQIKSFNLTLQIGCKPAEDNNDTWILEKPQLEVGDATDWEKYTGGQPSPSPDYPQEIKTLTGDIKLTSCGKNFIPLNSFFNNNDFILTNDLVTQKNKISASWAWTYNKAIFKFKIVKGTYTLTYFADILSTSTSAQFMIIDINNNIVATSQAKQTFDKGSISFTIDKDLEIGIVAKVYDGAWRFQLEKGTTATEYEPYQGSSLNITIPENEFIGKINDTYKDTLEVEYNKEDGHYHLILNKMIGKVVLDGSADEIWSAQLTNVSGKSRFRLDASKFNMKTVSKINEIGKIISTCFLPISVERTWFNYIGIAVDTSNYIFIYSEETSNFSITDFKNWLSTHNVEVYYALATPYEVELGVVDTLLSYDKITNIFSDSDLYPVINVKYYKDFEFDKILRSGYNIDEQEYEIAKKQMANGKRKRILSSYDDCIIKINLGLLDNKTYQEYKEQLDDGEFHYWSYKYNQYKKANFILTKPSITTEYAYDDDIGIDDIEITLEKSSDVS